MLTSLRWNSSFREVKRGIKMTFKISITDDTAELLFQDILRQDYLTIVENIAELENETDLPAHQKEDLENYRKVFGGLDTVLDWYFTFEQAKAIRDAVGK